MKWVLLTLLVLIAGCVTGQSELPSAGDNLIAETGDRVYVHYIGTLEDGTVFDSSEGREPLGFVVGAGQMIKGFDSAVVGMAEMNEKTVTLKPEDAYGEWDESKVIQVARNSVPADAKVGDRLYMQGYPVVVMELNPDGALLDANHQLAGKTLTFRIRMVGIEKK